ncbi:MAG: hypothetical protein ACC628_23050, partial [Pirellulaceae bacterium]
IAVALGASTMLADEPIQRLPPARIVIDEDILEAFVDEPCHHFEAARDAFVANRYPQAAEHLRKATAYLRLEAARASDSDRAALDASVRALQATALAVNHGQVRAVERLYEAFARAHLALANHHCIKSAHRCCRPGTFSDKREMSRTGHDLKAATMDLSRALRWAGDKPDKETQQLLDASQRAADKLIQQEGGSQVDVQRAIHRLHGKLENLIGRKIMLAQPLTPVNDGSAREMVR